MEDDFRAHCEEAAREQGVDVVVAELARRGIEAALWQTGGYVMCFGIKVGDEGAGADIWVQGNACCAAAFHTPDCQPESMIATICEFPEDEEHGVEVAAAVAEWIAKRVAERFDARLRDALTAEEYAEVRRRNRTPEYAGCCASHDFCDANMVMLAAMSDCGIDDASPAADVWHEAWRLWIADDAKGGAA